MSDLLVLMIDGDPKTRATVSHALEDHATVITAADGDTGIAMAEMKYPDVIILDLMLPKRSGFLVLEYLRFETEIVCPVVVLTDHDGARQRKYAEVLGVDRYLRKPCDPHSIRKCVLTLTGKQVGEESLA